MASESDRRIFVMRHLPYTKDLSDQTGWMPEAHLAPEAEAMAERLNETHLKGVEFNQYVASMLLRTAETIKLVRTDATSIILADALGPGDFDLWADIIRLKLETPRDCYQQSPELLRKRGSEFRFLMRQIVSTLEPGQNALLCSHGPLIESAIASATDNWPPIFAFNKGDVGVFIFPEEGDPHFDYLPLA